jgi:hypothetical protein
MDPVTALGVAAAVVQFVDYASTLISSTIRIYRSGRDSEHSTVLETIVKDLVQRNDQLSKSASTLSYGQCLPRDEDLRQLCGKCNRVAKDLIIALERLKVGQGNKIWASFIQALRTMWSEAEIELLRKNLDSFRQQISMYVLVSVRYVKLLNGKMDLLLI